MTKYQTFFLGFYPKIEDYFLGFYTFLYICNENNALFTHYNLMYYNRGGLTYSIRYIVFR